MPRPALHMSCGRYLQMLSAASVVILRGLSVWRQTPRPEAVDSNEKGATTGRTQKRSEFPEAIAPAELPLTTPGLRRLNILTHV